MSRYKPRLGPNAKRMLQMIADRPKGISTEAIKREKIYLDPWLMARTLDSFAAKEFIALSDDGKRWCITPDGQARLNGEPEKTVDDCDDDYKGAIVPPRRMQFDGLYQGEELRPQQSRPGGNTHTTIPSLMNGVRHFPGLGNRS